MIYSFLLNFKRASSFSPLLQSLSHISFCTLYLGCNTKPIFTLHVCFPVRYHSDCIFGSEHQPKHQWPTQRYCSWFSVWTSLLMTPTKPQCCCCSADLLLRLHLLCRYAENCTIRFPLFCSISVFQLTPRNLNFPLHFPGLHPVGIYKNL